MPLSFTAKTEKFESVDTCTPYDVAPEEGRQRSAGFVFTLEAPFNGERKVGARGGVEKVEKCQTDDQGLAPAEFEARTRQK
jgi:hypothetical protein